MKARDYVSPAGHSPGPASWLWDFFQSWLKTREYSLLLTGLPAVIVFFSVAGFACWQHTGLDSRLVADFDAAIDEALATNDTEKVVVYGEELLRRRPGRHKLRLQLLDHYAKNGPEHLDRVRQHLEVLTSGHVDYLPAHVWLLRRAADDGLPIPRSAEDIEAHCQRVLKGAPTNVFARKIMARRLLAEGQLNAAEDHLRTIAPTNPEVGLLLGCIQHQLKRHPDEVKRHLSNALEHFRKSILASPDDLRLRVQFSETATLLGQHAEAERVLKDGLIRENAPALRKALSKLYGVTAAEQYRLSRRNVVSARALFAKAIHLDPENTRILRQALALAGSEPGYTPEQLSPAVTFLKSQPPENADHRLLLNALLASSRLPEALELANTSVADHPDLITVRIQLLRRLHRDQDADRLSQETLAKLAVPATSLDRLIKAELLFMQSEFEHARQVLQTPVTDTGPGQTLSAVNADARSAELACRIALAIFDQHIQRPSDVSPVDVLKLLDEPLQQKSTAGIAMNRVVIQAYANGPFSSAAKQMLSRLLATGSVNAQVYSLIGAHALAAGEIRDARKYLELAYDMGRNNPVVLNNLALAITRDSVEDKSRALELCNSALAIAPGDPQLLVTRAEFYVATENWQDARRDLEVALSQRKSSIQLRQLLIKAYTALNETELVAEHQSLLKQLIGRDQKAGGDRDPS